MLQVLLSIKQANSLFVELFQMLDPTSSSEKLVRVDVGDLSARPHADQRGLRAGWLT
jgi:hypothetical protein